MSDTNYKRYEKSLGLLTMRVVNLLQKADDGILDLKNATQILEVRQKRRIYDITNVLEGVGLIEKFSKNSIKWKGVSPGNNSSQLEEKIEELRQEVAKLEEEEKLLDLHKQWIEQSIVNVMDEESNLNLEYVTDEDIKKCFQDSQILVFEAPLGVNIAASTSQNGDGTKKFILHLKSPEEPVSVILMGTNDEKNNDNEAETMKESDKDLLELSDSEESLYNSELLRLTPPVSSNDFAFSLRGSEGVCDLFDIPV